LVHEYALDLTLMLEEISMRSYKKAFTCMEGFNQGGI